MKVLKLITLGLGIFVLGSAAIGIGSIGNTVSKGDEKAKAFTVVSGAVTLGMDERTVLMLAGEPETKSRDRSAYGGTVSTTDYWYYGVLSTDGWQLVFDEGKLTAMNQG